MELEKFAATFPPLRSPLGAYYDRRLLYMVNLCGRNVLRITPVLHYRDHVL